MMTIHDHGNVDANISASVQNAESGYPSSVLKVESASVSVSQATIIPTDNQLIVQRGDSNIESLKRFNVAVVAVDTKRTK